MVFRTSSVSLADSVVTPSALHHIELKERAQGQVWLWRLLPLLPSSPGQQSFDLLVIGGGSGGLACAKEGM